ncbi:hypothetical protein L484_005717 [Morus notabilis]|uniref:THO1-MOS11 C-terminal domain-containing protein n=1 Tax=Morus notabilis TaxID=981085 RepID=W9QBS5_9ROSA|nr:protein MODIFIER OF SNC1 11 [Morus notabilis]EXB23428.1 hypothetical protein L484_005717 [Morus notabilis]
MATDSQKPSDNNPSVENPTIALDPAAPPTAKLQDPKTDASSAAPPSPSDSVSGKEAEGASKSAEVPTAASAAVATVSDIEKKMRRAERFGISVQLTEEEKRNSRAERFGTGSSSGGSELPKKSEELKRKARAERFSTSSTPVASNPEEEAKKKARLARFAPASKTDPVEDDKRKARAIRFASTPSNSLSQTNGNGQANIEPSNAAIAGKAGGGA